MKHETPIDLWLYEKEAFADGFQLVCGVDEAGRGPLAGPVFAAAVILPPELVIPGLNDSKKLTDKKRRELCSVITAEAVSYGIAFASEQEIDEIKAKIEAGELPRNLQIDRKDDLSKLKRKHYNQIKGHSVSSSVFSIGIRGGFRKGRESPHRLGYYSFRASRALARLDLAPPLQRMA